MQVEQSALRQPSMKRPTWPVVRARLRYLHAVVLLTSTRNLLLISRRTASAVQGWPSFCRPVDSMIFTFLNCASVSSGRRPRGAGGEGFDGRNPSGPRWLYRTTMRRMVAGRRPTSVEMSPMVGGRPCCSSRFIAMTSQYKPSRTRPSRMAR